MALTKPGGTIDELGGSGFVRFSERKSGYEP